MTMTSAAIRGGYGTDSLGGTFIWGPMIKLFASTASEAWAASPWSRETFSILFRERPDKITSVPHATAILAITASMPPKPAMKMNVNSGFRSA
ncbi:hypothetical protein Q8G17_14440 [Klebsiella pneumoniae]|uniref:hypothetical protein n=1 Tax=Klebsiella pneumoniae TaxID=573 RepID=UPI002730A7EF|nr:hypothetical protein [Klebsiella pneumoniae]MDP0615521.1 hypothetical protein [Klebsiella pneumoniae]